MMNPAHIGLNIRSLREAMSLTQQEVSSYLGIARELISYYETGSREIPADTLHRLADLFGVELADLMKEEASKKAAIAAFAFQAGNMDTQALESIAAFRRVVRNYLKMEKLLAGK